MQRGGTEENIKTIQSFRTDAVTNLHSSRGARIGRWSSKEVPREKYLKKGNEGA